MQKSIALLWALIRPHLGSQRHLMLLAVLLTALATACSLTASWRLKGLVDLPVPGGSMPDFFVSVAIVAVIYVAAFLLWAGQQTLAAIMTERIFIAVKTRLLLQLLKEPYSTFDTMMHADILVRLTANLRQAAVTFRDDVVTGMFEIFFILGILGSLLIVDWRVGLGAFVVLFLYAVVIKSLERPWLYKATKGKKAGDAIADVYVDVLAAVRDIRIFNLSNRIIEKFERVTKHYAETQIVLSRFTALLRGFVVLLGALAVLALVAAYGTLIIQQSVTQNTRARLTAGELVVMLTILTILINTLNQLLMRVGRLIAVQPSLGTLSFLAFPLDQPLQPPQEQLRPEDLIPSEPSIEFQGIGYSRSKDTSLINNFSLRIEAGEKIALMGATGTGKSMLLDLLMRLREPNEGRILYSGIDIRHIEPALYYSAFGVVGQQSHVMQITLKQFLLQGWPGQQDADLWRVLDLVKLSGMVRGLPQQLDTQVGFYARGFSGNETQRLAVARALLRDPQVLVLDDFTATLDAQAELELVRDVLAQSKRRTVIMTTYSPQVAALFDRKVVLQRADS